VCAVIIPQREGRVPRQRDADTEVEDRTRTSLHHQGNGCPQWGWRNTALLDDGVAYYSASEPPEADAAARTLLSGSIPQQR